MSDTPLILPERIKGTLVVIRAKIAHLNDELLVAGSAEKKPS